MTMVVEEVDLMVIDFTSNNDFMGLWNIGQ